MTAPAKPMPVTSEALPSGNLVRDSITMTKRNLLRLTRTPQIIVFATIQPLMFVFLFNFVFGGSIDLPGMRYIDFLIPGILVQTALFAGGNTAIGLAQDLEKGAIDRFRSLPMSRPAVLIGRTLADGARSLVTVVVILGVGFVLGFRPTTNVLNWIAAVALGVAFGYAFTWTFTFVALKVKDVEAVQTAAFLPVFPLAFAASTFAPVQNMPGWLQAFASRQPVTLTIDSMRALFHGGDVWASLPGAIAWIVGIIVVSAFFSIREFERSSS